MRTKKQKTRDYFLVQKKRVVCKGNYRDVSNMKKVLCSIVLSENGVNLDRELHIIYGERNLAKFTQ